MLLAGDILLASLFFFLGGGGGRFSSSICNTASEILIKTAERLKDGPWLAVRSDTAPAAASVRIYL